MNDTPMHTLRNALAATLLLPCILLAATPAHEWRADLADTGAATLYARHGDEIGLACRLTLRGEPYAPASALCHYQTNGMGAAWWEAPVTLASNVATVAWSPALDPGADLVLLLLEFDGAHRAALHLHLRPGPAPGGALPPPTTVLDFAAQPYTNAPWALPADLSAYATTGYVAAAIASIDIPAPDLSAYATTGLVAEAAAGKEDISPEWRAATVDRIVASASSGVSHAATNTVGDVGVVRTTAATLLAIDLSAIRLDNADGSESDIPGTFSILAGAEFATLYGATLMPTASTGPVSIGFAGTDGTTLRTTIAMSHAEPGTRISVSTLEVADTWRKAYADALAARFLAIDPDGPKTVYRHMRGGLVDFAMTNLDAQQLYTLSDGGTPSAVNSGFFAPDLADLMRCCSAGRTDYNTGPSVRPAMFVAPHYAICAGHYTPSQGTFCLDRSAPAFQRYAFSRVASRNDLAVLRTPTAFPADLLPSFARASDIRAATSSCLTNTLGLYQSQSSCVHPCVVTPLDGNGGWTTSAISFGRNPTYASLAPYEHSVQGGDSGHAVCLWLGGRLVPVGLYNTAGGSADSLVADETIDWLSSVIRSDSGNTETIHVLSRSDLLGE